MNTRKRLFSREDRLDSPDPALWVLVLAALFLAVTASIFARLYYYNVVDDAYISFQYTRNLVEGRGLVFNEGEVVEGYTNFLWVVLLAPVYAVTQWVGVDFTKAAIGVSTLISILNLGLIYAIARKLFDRDSFAISVTLILCVLDNAYLGYATSGLENPLLMLCSLVAVYAWVRPAKHAWAWTGGALAAACMTRPDAGLLVGAFGLSALLAVGLKDPFRPWESRRALLKTSFLTVVVWLLVFGSYFAWRFHYFGEWLPNTFHLKVGSQIDGTQRGLVYLTSFFENRYWVPALVALTLFWPRHMVIRWLLLWVLIHAAYVVYIGGDFYSGHRFLVALLPSICLLIGWVIHRLNRWIQKFRFVCWMKARGWPAAIAIAIIYGGLAFGLFHFTHRGFETGPYTHEITLFRDGVNNNVKYSRWLGTFSRRGESIVAGDIGSAGFFTNLIVYDVFGVIDPVVARMQPRGFGKGKAGHEKRASRQYLMDKKPTYVKWGYVPGDLRPFGYWVFTEFPPGFRQDGLWVKENLLEEHFLPESTIHFQASDLLGWQPTGNAFSKAPTSRPVTGQAPPFGFEGPYINSFIEGLGDRATGTLLSTPIQLQGDLMVLLVGGGRDEERLRVSLLVDGNRVASATGSDHEVLGRRVWDISHFKGKQGRIEIVDQSVDGWGHIMVDEIRQWSKTKGNRNGIED